MKLIDTTKDTRITHLLRQTDGYLESLPQAVRAQQSDGRENYNFDQEEGPGQRGILIVLFLAMTSATSMELIRYRPSRHTTFAAR